MAFSYILDVATPLPVAQVAVELYRVGLEIGSFTTFTGEGQILDPGVVTASGAWLRMVETKYNALDAVVAGLGFRPTLFAVFEFGKAGDFELQSNEIVHLVSGILDRVPGDLVLHYQYEVILLLRLGGELSISDRDDLWPSDRVALLTQPYRRMPLTFPE